jgi:prepilin-type N-terminal cleavage/methylation domain-containing protein
MMTANGHRGFSLPETIIALAIFALMSASAATLLYNMRSGERRERAMAEVESQGNYVMYQIAQSARNASAIASPATSTSATTTQLASVVAGENPTVYSLSSGAVVMKKGTAATTTLTSATVNATGLTFTNLSGTGTRSLRIAVTLSYKNPTGRADSAFSQAFYTSVTLR